MYFLNLTLHHLRERERERERERGIEIYYERTVTEVANTASGVYNYKKTGHVCVRKREGEGEKETVRI